MAGMKVKKRSLGAEELSGDSVTDQPTTKRVKLLDDESDDSDAESRSSGGIQLNGNGSLKINQEFARRFEHNEKRKERERLEEKYGDDDGSETDESTSEDEDDDGELATAGLDEEINATLQAIRAKDPRVYDKEAKFYREVEDGDEADAAGADGEGERAQKPMYIKDYHRKNFLEGNGVTADESEVPPVRTMAQQEQDLKESVIREMHAAMSDEDEGQDGDDAFLVRKSRPVPAEKPRAPLPDVDTADRDPDTFLSNFMASRAWVPTVSSKWQPFESDDEDEDERADAFEEAYNLRYEDPQRSNEKLMTHSREAAAKYSVRREDVSGRKKVRERERERKEEERRQRHEDRNRLRKLKIEETEAKVEQIKKSAGMRGGEVDLKQWASVLDEDWDDEKWEREMNSRFGKDYYAEGDDGVEGAGEDEDGAAVDKRRSGKMPKWDDDIDITDIVPDFEQDEEKPQFTLSDIEDVADDDGADDAAHAINGDVEHDSDTAEGTAARRKTKKKDRAHEAADQKRAAKRDRRIIESLVEQNLDVDLALAAESSGIPVSANGIGDEVDDARPQPQQPRSLFRYRETSPVSFGLTAADILRASDAQLNEFVGLKKLTAFRDPERRRRDRKKLGKKARLREWRREVFRDDGEGAGAEADKGDRQGGNGKALGSADVPGDGKEGEGKRKKKRSRKNKAKPVQVSDREQGANAGQTVE